jgi:uncharacterized membrane protein YoaK (UPF0700 family)
MLFGLIFLSFLVGGVCGGFSEVRWGSMTLVVPMAGLAIMAVEDWFAPLRHGPPQS